MPVVWVLPKYNLCFVTAGLPAPWSYLRALHCAFDLLKNLFRGNLNVQSCDSNLRKFSGKSPSSLSSAQLIERVYCLLKGWLFCLSLYYFINWSTEKNGIMGCWNSVGTWTDHICVWRDLSQNHTPKCSAKSLEFFRIVHGVNFFSGLKAKRENWLKNNQEWEECWFYNIPWLFYKFSTFFCVRI